MIRRRYVDGPFGQIHVRENTPTGGPALVCLHATAYSSRTFTRLLEVFDGTRHLLAIDTPGYGESDPAPHPLSMAGYADAIAGAVLPEVVDIDVLGYHTGVYIAAEMALRHPHGVHRLVFCGIPYFQALQFEEWRARLTRRHSLDENLAQFDERWHYLVANRPQGLALTRAFQNFVDELKAWPDGSRAHEALFAYDPDHQLPRILQPVLVLNTAGHLAAASRTAAAMMRDVDLIDMGDLSGAPFDTGSGAIAAAIEAFLSVRAVTSSVA
jgi:pimeloyl-ACP methyl ester carboxylesterase